jgi:hypothetical protein
MDLIIDYLVPVEDCRPSEQIVCSSDTKNLLLENFQKLNSILEIRGYRAIRFLSIAVSLMALARQATDLRRRKSANLRPSGPKGRITHSNSAQRRHPASAVASAAPGAPITLGLAICTRSGLGLRQV